MSDSAADGVADEPASDNGPFLIVAAMWHETDDADEVVERLHGFTTPDGYSRGVVVAFRHEVADSEDFRRDLRRFDLGELNERQRGAP